MDLSCNQDLFRIKYSITVMKLHAHIPYPILTERMDDIVDASINPEVYFDNHCVDTVDLGVVADIKRRLDAAGLSVTIHGPYMDLCAGAVDEKVREVTVERYLKTLEIAEVLRPLRIVLHAGYDEKRFDGDVALWLSQSLKTWQKVVPVAERVGTVITVENVFEEEPAPIRRLVESVNSTGFGVCVDAGHMNLFSKVEMDEWFHSLGRWIKEVHIHDNHGEYDEHLPVGEGVIDFPRFFTLLEKHTDGVVYTLEQHSEEALRRGILSVRPYLG